MRLTFALRVALVSVLAIFSGMTAASAQGQDTVTIGIETTVGTWDCWFASENNCIVLSRLWGDNLFEFDPKEPSKLRPNLATSWKFIDPTTLEIALRKGVKFHNGEPFDANAVKAQLEFLVDPKSGANLRYGIVWLKRVDVVNDLTVRLIYNAPNAPGILRLAQFGTMYPREYYQKAKTSGFGQQPIGTGPYRFASWQRDRQVVFEANPDYSGPKGKPRFRRIVVRFIPEVATRVAELLTGGVDVIHEVPPDQVQVIRASAKAVTYEASTNRMVFLNVDASGRAGESALQNVKVRQAIAHAIDKNAIAKQILSGFADVRESMSTPFMFGHTENIRKYEYNPAKSRQLLAEAGFPNGFKTEYIATIPQQQAVQAVVGYLRAVGINANLQYLGGDVATAGRLIASGKAPLSSELWTTIPDVDALLSPFLMPGNPRTYANDAQLADWLRSAAASIDPDQRRELYAKALARIADQAYLIPLYAPKAIYAARSDLDFSGVGTSIYPQWWELKRK